MPSPQPDSSATCALLERIRAGDRLAIDEVLQRHRMELRRFVQIHLDPQLRTRFDPSDIVQDTQMELVRRLGDFLALNPMPFHLWQRRKAYERLLNLRRDHVLRKGRSVQREVRWPDYSSMLVARPFISDEVPRDVLEVRERDERVQRAVARLPLPDREILLLRHAEDLSFDDAACILGITPVAARKRFGRALIRLQKFLAEEGILGEH